MRPGTRRLGRDVESESGISIDSPLLHHIPASLKVLTGRDTSSIPSARPLRTKDSGQKAIRALAFNFARLCDMSLWNRRHRASPHLCPGWRKRTQFCSTCGLGLLRTLLVIVIIQSAIFCDEDARFCRLSSIAHSDFHEFLVATRPPTHRDHRRGLDSRLGSGVDHAWSARWGPFAVDLPDAV